MSEEKFDSEDFMDDFDDDSDLLPEIQAPGLSARIETVHGSLSGLGMRIDALLSSTSSHRSSLSDQLGEYSELVSRLARSQAGDLEEYRRANERNVSALRRSLSVSEQMLDKVSARIEELVTDSEQSDDSSRRLLGEIRSVVDAQDKLSRFLTESLDRFGDRVLIRIEETQAALASSVQELHQALVMARNNELESGAVTSDESDQLRVGLGSIGEQLEVLRSGLESLTDNTAQLGMSSQAVADSATAIEDLQADYLTLRNLIVDLREERVGDQVVEQISRSLQEATADLDTRMTHLVGESRLGLPESVNALGTRIDQIGQAVQFLIDNSDRAQVSEAEREDMGKSFVQMVEVKLNSVLDERSVSAQLDDRAVTAIRGLIDESRPETPNVDFGGMIHELSTLNNRVGNLASVDELQLMTSRLGDVSDQLDGLKTDISSWLEPLDGSSPVSKHTTSSLLPYLNDIIGRLGTVDQDVRALHEASANTVVDVQTDTVTSHHLDEFKAELSAQLGESKQAMVEANQASVEVNRAIVEINQAIVEANQAMVEAKQASIEANQVSVEAKQASVEANQAMVEVNRAIVEANQASVEAKQASIEAKDQINSQLSGLNGWMSGQLAEVASGEVVASLWDEVRGVRGEVQGLSEMIANGLIIEAPDSIAGPDISEYLENKVTTDQLNRALNSMVSRLEQRLDIMGDRLKTDLGSNGVGSNDAGSNDATLKSINRLAAQVEESMDRSAAVDLGGEMAVLREELAVELHAMRSALTKSPPSGGEDDVVLDQLDLLGDELTKVQTVLKDVQKSVAEPKSARSPGDRIGIGRLEKTLDAVQASIEDLAQRVDSVHQEGSSGSDVDTAELASELKALRRRINVRAEQDVFTPSQLDAIAEAIVERLV